MIENVPKNIIFEGKYGAFSTPVFRLWDENQYNQLSTMGFKLRSLVSHDSHVPFDPENRTVLWSLGFK